jgi:hypothetical protein
MLEPTAMHAVITAHDTPRRRVSVAPAGFGVVWIDQLVPFQASASDVTLAPLLEYPTATHDLADRQ